MSNPDVFEQTALELGDTSRNDDLGGRESQERFDPLRPNYIDPGFLQTLEQMRRDVMEDADNDSDTEGRWFVPAIQSIALVATSGLLAGVLRAGSLVAMAVTSLPFWRSADPLMVLSLSDEERRDLESNLRDASSGERNLDEVFAGGAQTSATADDEKDDEKEEEAD